jgi:hypothetical protein
MFATSAGDKQQQWRQPMQRHEPKCQYRREPEMNNVRLANVDMPNSVQRTMTMFADAR